jgi:hypothetical protein
MASVKLGAGWPGHTRIGCAVWLAGRSSGSPEGLGAGRVVGERSPETMLETFRWFRGEGFGLIAEALLGLPREPGVIVEGFRVLPHLVRPLLAMPGHAVWLPPMTDFRRAASDSRCSLWVPGEASGPLESLASAGAEAYPAWVWPAHPVCCFAGSMPPRDRVHQQGGAITLGGGPGCHGG